MLSPRTGRGELLGAVVVDLAAILKQMKVKNNCVGVLAVVNCVGVHTVVNCVGGSSSEKLLTEKLIIATKNGDFTVIV